MTMTRTTTDVLSGHSSDHQKCRAFRDFDFAEADKIVSHAHLSFINFLVRADFQTLRAMRQVAPDWMDAYDEWNDDRYAYYMKYGMFPTPPCDGTFAHPPPPRSSTYSRVTRLAIIPRIFLSSVHLSITKSSDTNT